MAVLLIPLLLIQRPALAAVGLQTPAMGYSNWNSFQNKINASLFRDTAKFMKDSGLLDAGYIYITLGGIGYANGSTYPSGAHSWGPGGAGNITRNATGFLQVDPVRFPGGNEGMRELTDDIRALGFKWGHYTESGTKGCNGARGSSEGFEVQDAALFFEDFKSEYLMVDGCGIEARPPPAGPPNPYPVCPGCSPAHAQSRWEMSRWRTLIDEAVANGTVDGVVLHDCHNGCGSDFGGPTLALAPCDPSDAAQQWSLPLDGTYGTLTSAGNGMCAGCVSTGSCGGDGTNGTGLGMQACLSGSVNNGALDSKGAAYAHGLGAQGQLVNYTLATGAITLACPNKPGCVQRVLAPVAPEKNVGTAAAAIPVVATKTGTGAIASWIATPLPAGGPLHLLQVGTTTTSFKNSAAAAAAAMCLSSSTGPVVVPVADPWCLANNNMWRSNTDVLQNWCRTMVEVESLATQGTISRPGAWSFPDCLELGVPGGGSLTWQESQTVLALFAITSSPLILGNDPRPGRMQQRLVDLLTNPDMIAVNQQYDATAKFAGGRIASFAPGKEVWAKPLAASGVVAVVLMNRGGVAIGERVADAGPLPKKCKDSPLACTGCQLPGDQPWLAPCDDNVTASTGAQTIELDIARMIPAAWLTEKMSGSGESERDSESSVAAAVQCDVFDIFATPHKGKALGRFATWSAMVPPHGVRFLRLSNCA